MSTMKAMVPKLNTVDSIYNYLREPTASEVVSSTTPSTVLDSTRNTSQLKSNKRRKKEKETANLMDNLPTDPQGLMQALPAGRLRYGPITVKPRKQPSKTLFTGRRSKYEVLSTEEEEKRRSRRERNRIAATKCREKREDILSDLENEFDHLTNISKHLLSTVQQLEQRKMDLHAMLSNYSLQPINLPPEPPVFGHTDFLSSISVAPARPLPPHQLQLIANDEEEFVRLLQPEPVLTNSAYNADQSNYLFNSQPTITMSSGSLEQIINNLQSPISYVNNSNNAPQELVNSAYGSSTCARQHSSSGDDESMLSTHKKSYVF